MRQRCRKAACKQLLLRQGCLLASHLPPFPPSPASFQGRRFAQLEGALASREAKREAYLVHRLEASAAEKIRDHRLWVLASRDLACLTWPLACLLAGWLDGGVPWVCHDALEMRSSESVRSPGADNRPWPISGA